MCGTATTQSPSVSSQWAKASSRFFSPSSPPISSISSAAPLRLKLCLPIHNDASILRPEKNRPCIFWIRGLKQATQRATKETCQNAFLCAYGIPKLYSYDAIRFFLWVSDERRVTEKGKR